MSPIKQEFKDAPTFSNLGPINANLAARLGEVKIKMTMPQSVMFSVLSQVTENWAVMGTWGGRTGLSSASRRSASAIPRAPR